MPKDFMELNGERYELPDLDDLDRRAKEDRAKAQEAKDVQEPQVEPEPEPQPAQTDPPLDGLPGVEAIPQSKSEPNQDFGSPSQVQQIPVEPPSDGGDVFGRGPGDNGQFGGDDEGDEGDIEEERMVAVLAQLTIMNGTLHEILKALEG
tara:strand:- start:10477 stop:10923 length:447 start_codon:yes stop_codon:yes gene_type:complete